jgi:hypothetical protein
MADFITYPESAGQSTGAGLPADFEDTATKDLPG